MKTYFPPSFIAAKQLLVLAALALAAACGDTDTPADNKDTGTATVAAIPVINYTVGQQYPHDTAAFTQGLIWHNGLLFEGTGQLGQSNLRKVDLATGKVLAQTNNTDDVFGEGITLFNNKIYQLSWQNRKGFVYDAATLKKLEEFPLNTEGWGITHNGKELIVSDGSSNLYFLDPVSFKEIRRVGVTDNYGYVSELNELEYIDGFVYANKWRTNYILKIDADNGKVAGRMDLSQLKGIVQAQLEDPDNNVLNGIAYDSTSRTMYVTGKNWPALFAITLQ